MQKILEETETEETINFFVRFSSFAALQFGVPGSLQSTPMMLIHRSMDLDYWWPYLVSNIKMVSEVIVSSYVYGVFGAQRSRDCAVTVLVSQIKRGHVTAL